MVFFPWIGKASKKECGACLVTDKFFILWYLRKVFVVSNNWGKVVDKHHLKSYIELNVWILIYQKIGFFLYSMITIFVFTKI